MFDLKVIHSVLEQLQEERGIPKEKIIEAIEAALATAYKKEYGKKGQIVRATFNLGTGATEFFQVKIVVDETKVIFEDKESAEKEAGEKSEKTEKVSKIKKSKKVSEETEAPINPDDEFKVHFNPEHHILLEDAKKIKKDAKIDDEIVFPLEVKGDYGRIASQTATQVIIQKIREAEKVSVLGEYGKREGEIVSGTVQRLERGNIFLVMGRTTAILPYEEQIPGDRYRQGERVHAILLKVEEGARGVFIKLSRSSPKFLEKLFAKEAPEIVGGTVEIKGVVREAGSRSKVAATSHDEHVDPVGSLVGQRGVRVSTVMSELGGEKIDIIEWSADPKKYIEESLSPAKVVSVDIDEDEHKATVTVD